MKNIVITLFVIAVIAGGFILLNRPKQVTTPPQTTQTESTSKALAGESAPFIEFNKADYDKALTENKVILLDFYANWCPICRAEAPIINEGFNSLTTDKVVGFRVNFKDSDTDEDEKTLAKEFNIPYQHTKIILKNGREFSRSLDSWTKETFDTEVAKALQ